MEPLIAALLVLSVAAIFSPLGIGAGIAYVPIFHYGLGLDFVTEAVPISLCLVWISSLSTKSSSQSDDGVRGDIHLPAVLLKPQGSVGRASTIC